MCSDLPDPRQPLSRLPTGQRGCLRCPVGAWSVPPATPLHPAVAPRVGGAQQLRADRAEGAHHGRSFCPTGRGAHGACGPSKLPPLGEHRDNRSRVAAGIVRLELAASAGSIQRGHRRIPPKHMDAAHTTSTYGAHLCAYRGSCTGGEHSSIPRDAEAHDGGSTSTVEGADGARFHREERLAILAGDLERGDGAEGLRHRDSGGPPPARVPAAREMRPGVVASIVLPFSVLSAIQAPLRCAAVSIGRVAAREQRQVIIQ